MAADTKVLIDGLCFPEGPRWHGGKLWFSDMHEAVLRVGLDGRAETVVEVPTNPSGLGWLPDGRLLVVSMQRSPAAAARRTRCTRSPICRRSPTSTATTWSSTRLGRAYVGNFGFDLHGGPRSRRRADAVEPEARVVAASSRSRTARDHARRRTLIIAESIGGRDSPRSTSPRDGSLANRRVFAQLEGGTIPDGICLDAEGAIWVASPVGHECVRVHEGGRISARIESRRRPSRACSAVRTARRCSSAPPRRTIP